MRYSNYTIIVYIMKRSGHNIMDQECIIMVYYMYVLVCHLISIGVSSIQCYIMGNTLVHNNYASTYSIQHFL